jgi:diguanylate cyclase (GGDEF)-like protein/PAS domain S-box-containing protein
VGSDETATAPQRLPLRVLILDDTPTGADRMVDELRRSGFDVLPTCVATEAEYVAALDTPFDMILASHSVPEFDAFLALRRLQQRGLDIPFVIVAGSNDEESVVGALRLGASDYLIEDRLSRLGPAVERALERKRLGEVNRAAAEEVRVSDARYRALVEQLPPILVTRVAGALGTQLYVGPQAEAVLGYSQSAWSHDPNLWFKLIHPEDAAWVLAAMRRRRETDEQLQLEYRMIARGGRVVWVRSYSIVIRDTIANTRYVQWLMLNITERKYAEQALKDIETRYRTLVEQIPAITYIGASAGAGAAMYVSPQVDGILGFTPTEWKRDPNSWISAVHPDDRPQVRAELERSTETGSALNVECRFVAREGRSIWMRCHAVLVRDETGAPQFWHGVMFDVNESKQLEQQLQHQAFHDALTGLPNRALLRDRLEHALKRMARKRGAVGLLFVGLDNFKVVNDSIGHESGDALLRQVAQRIVGSLRAGDTAARHGSDEFAVLVEEISKTADAALVAERLIEGFQQPFDVGGREFVLSASIGIAVSISAHDRADDLLRHADVAMSQAKRLGRARYAMFDPSMSAHIEHRLELEHELRRAVDGDELQIYFQPIVDLTNGEVRELEALVRWQHPHKGLISPAEFIPIAEETGLIIPIGNWIVDEACRHVGAWQRTYPDSKGISVSINISARQFQHEALVADVARALNQAQVNASRLRIELAESSMMRDVDLTISTLTALKALGVQFAIDDFGTGYSSLAYLKRFPVDTLKIDRAFIAEFEHSREDRALVRSIIAAGKALQLTVTAEGIERETQLAELRTLGCDRGQGYIFSEPLPPEEIGRLLAAGKLAYSVRRSKLAS